MTMVRNDDFFLPRWVEYYSRELGKENVYVYFDGTDQTVPECCGGINVIMCEHKEEDVVAGDRRRARFLSREADKRFSEGYSAVIGTDVDEFLVVDPDLGVTLKEFILRQRPGRNISALGVDVGQHLGNEQRGIAAEKEIEDGKSFLSQRGYGFLYSRYTKANVLRRSGSRWGSGFHRVKGRNFHISPGLYLFHFGAVDFERLRRKTGDDELVKAGWSRHLKKRARTIRIITESRPMKWDKTVKAVRRFMSIFRPIYAINKPTLYGIRIVVRIPERFRGQRRENR